MSYASFAGWSSGQPFLLRHDDKLRKTFNSPTKHTPYLPEDRNKWRLITSVTFYSGMAANIISPWQRRHAYVQSRVAKLQQNRAVFRRWRVPAQPSIRLIHTHDGTTKIMSGVETT